MGVLVYMSLYLFKIVSFSCFALLMSACSMVQTSLYDSSTDKSLIRLHKQTAQFFIVASGPAHCGYDDHLEFYHKSRVALSGLQVRASAMAENNGTVSQLNLLSSSYENLAKLHQLGCFSPAQVNELWVSFDVSFSAILKLELAKKYGR